MEESFSGIFIPGINSKRMIIPTDFTDYKNGEFPEMVPLKDRFGNIWQIGVTKKGRHFCFEYGWKEFIEENTVVVGDFFVFDYDGCGFDFTLLGKDGCEKEGVGGLKLDREMNDEHQKNIEPKGKYWASDSSNEDSDEDYMIEKKTKKAPHSKRYVKEEEDNDDDEEEKETEEDKNERADTFKKKTLHSKAGCNRGAARKVREHQEQYGVDTFKSGRAIQPKNPYFIKTIRSNKRDLLYVRIDVVRDYKLKLPFSMTIRDSVGREFETKLKSGKDGRIWLIGGWRSFCRRNLVEKKDRCICEFKRGKRDKGLALQVRVIHEGASSHSNKKK